MSLYFSDPQAAESEETLLLLLLGVYVLGLFGGWRGVSGILLPQHGLIREQTLALTWRKVH